MGKLLEDSLSPGSVPDDSTGLERGAKGEEAEWARDGQVASWTGESTRRDRKTRKGTVVWPSLA